MRLFHCTVANHHCTREKVRRSIYQNGWCATAHFLITFIWFVSASHDSFACVNLFFFPRVTSWHFCGWGRGSLLCFLHLDKPPSAILSSLYSRCQDVTLSVPQKLILSTYLSNKSIVFHVFNQSATQSAVAGRITISPSLFWIVLFSTISTFASEFAMRWTPMHRLQWVTGFCSALICYVFVGPL